MVLRSRFFAIFFALVFAAIPSWTPAPPVPAISVTISPTVLMELSAATTSKVEEIAMLRAMAKPHNARIATYGGTSREIVSFVTERVNSLGSVQAYRNWLNAQERIHVGDFHRFKSDLDIMVIPNEGCSGISPERLGELSEFAARAEAALPKTQFYSKTDLTLAPAFFNGREIDSNHFEAISNLPISERGLEALPEFNTTVDGVKVNMAQWGLEQLSQGKLQLRYNTAIDPGTSTPYPMFRQALRWIRYISEYPNFSIDAPSIAAIKKLIADTLRFHRADLLSLLNQGHQRLTGDVPDLDFPGAKLILTLEKVEIYAADSAATFRALADFGVHTILRDAGIAESRIMLPLLDRPVGATGTRLGRELPVKHFTSLGAASNISKGALWVSDGKIYFESTKSNAFAGTGFYVAEGAGLPNYGDVSLDITLSADAIEGVDFQRGLDGEGRPIIRILTKNAIARGSDGKLKISSVSVTQLRAQFTQQLIEISAGRMVATKEEAANLIGSLATIIRPDRYAADLPLLGDLMKWGQQFEAQAKLITTLFRANDQAVQLLTNGKFEEFRTFTERHFNSLTVDERFSFVKRILNSETLNAVTNWTPIRNFLSVYREHLFAFNSRYSSYQHGDLIVKLSAKSEFRSEFVARLNAMETHLRLIGLDSLGSIHLSELTKYPEVFKILSDNLPLIATELRSGSLRYDTLAESLARNPATRQQMAGRVSFSAFQPGSFNFYHEDLKPFLLEKIRLATTPQEINSVLRYLVPGVNESGYQYGPWRESDRAIVRAASDKLLGWLRGSSYEKNYQPFGDALTWVEKLYYRSGFGTISDAVKPLRDFFIQETLAGRIEADVVASWWPDGWIVEDHINYAKILEKINPATISDHWVSGIISKAGGVMGSVRRKMQEPGAIRETLRRIIPDLMPWFHRISPTNLKDKIDPAEYRDYAKDFREIGETSIADLLQSVGEGRYSPPAAPISSGSGSLLGLRNQVASLLIAGGVLLSTVSTVTGAPDKIRVNVPFGPGDLQSVVANDNRGERILGDNIKWRVEPASPGYIPSAPLTVQVVVPSAAVKTDGTGTTVKFLSNTDLALAIENGNPQMRLTFDANNPLPAAVTIVGLQNDYGVAPRIGTPSYSASQGIRDALKVPLTLDNPNSYLFTDAAFQQRLIPVVQSQGLPLVNAYGGSRDNLDATVMRYNTGGNLETIHLGYVPLTTTSSLMAGASMAMLGLASAGSAAGQKLLNFGASSGASVRTPTFIGFQGAGGTQAAQAFVDASFNLQMGDYNLKLLTGSAPSGAAFSGGQLNISGLQVTAMTVGSPNGIGSTANPSGTSATLFAVKQGDFEYLAAGKNFLPTMASGLANMPLEQPIGRLLSISSSKVSIGLGTGAFLANTLATPAMMGAYDRAVLSLVDDPSGAAMNRSLLSGAGAGLWEGVKSFNPFTVHGLANVSGMGSMMALDSLSKVAGTSIGLALMPVMVADAAGGIYQMNQGMGLALDERLNAEWMENLRGRPEHLAMFEGIVAKGGYDRMNPDDPYLKSFLDSDLSWGESLGKFLVDRNATPSQIAESVVDMGLSFYLDQKYGVDMTEQEWVQFKAKELGWLSLDEAQVYESMESEKVMAEITHRQAMTTESLNELKDDLGIIAPKAGSGMFDFGGGVGSSPQLPDENQPQAKPTRVSAPLLTLEDPMVAKLQFMMSSPGLRYDLLDSASNAGIISNLDRTMAALSVSPLEPSRWEMSYDRPIPLQAFNTLTTNFLTDPLLATPDLWSAVPMSFDPFSSSFTYGGMKHAIATTSSGLAPVTWTETQTTGWSNSGFANFTVGYEFSSAPLDGLNLSYDGSALPASGQTPSTPIANTPKFPSMTTSFDGYWTHQIVTFPNGVTFNYTIWP